MAFITLFERKIIALFHYRKGPNKTGPFGIFQPFSDATKLISKEFFYPLKSNFNIFIIAPILIFILIIIIWIIYPFYRNLLNFKISFLYFLAIIRTTVYTLLIIGWRSNSTYSIIGALRSIAQSISYEVTFSIALIILLTIINSINFNFISHFKSNIPIIIIILIPILIIFISILAEINRTPFDLSEGESELVSGFNIEYGRGKFTLIFIAEYARLILIIFLFNLIIFNLNINNLYFYLNYIFILYFITWIRITFPRIRYDKLIYLCWFYLLPIILILFFFLILTIKLPLDLLFDLN